MAILSNLTVNRYDSKTKKWSKIHFESKKDKYDWLVGYSKLPGEYNYDERVKIFYEQATFFDAEGYYTDTIEGSFDFVDYWERQKELCYTGILIDDDFYITGDHYWYLNFIKIPDKVKNDFAFPRFQDLDAWTFMEIELAQLNDENHAVVKARQTGFTLKYLAKMMKRLWFEKAYAGKYATFDETYIKAGWNDILVPYRNHLNEHTGWYRSFKLSDEEFNWKQGFSVNENGKNKKKGNLSTLRAYTTKQRASKVVGGNTSELLYDEAGVSLNVGKVIELIEPAMKYGNIYTGTLFIIGAAGEMKESDSLKNISYAPRQNRCRAYPNVWSGKPDEEIIMFVPYYYAYGNCLDEFGNSDIERAKVEFAKEAETKQKKSFTDYAIFKAQYPETIEDAFSIQEENIFPVEKILPHYDYLTRHYNELTVTLVDDLSKPTGVRHIFGSKTPVITDFPIKKDTIRDGAIVVDEFPEENPPFGLYYVAVDPIRSVKTEDTKASIQSVYVYKAAHRLAGELVEDRMVAWFAGRSDDPNKTYETTAKIIKRWNARALIENDQRSCIEYMIGKKLQAHLMKRSDVPILRDWVPNSKIQEEYGVRTGSGNLIVLENYFSLVIEYCEEVIGTETLEDGTFREIYGVTRIKDRMLLKEMISYKKGGNYDRIIAFGIALLAARTNTNRGLMVVKRSSDQVEQPKPAPIRGLVTTHKILKSPFGTKLGNNLVKTKLN